jgi:hypothetical protein
MGISALNHSLLPSSTVEAHPTHHKNGYMAQRTAHRPASGGDRECCDQATPLQRAREAPQLGRSVAQADAKEQICENSEQSDAD